MVLVPIDSWIEVDRPRPAQPEPAPAVEPGQTGTPWPENRLLSLVFVRLVPGRPSDIVAALEAVGSGEGVRWRHPDERPATAAPSSCVLAIELRPGRLRRRVPMEIQVSRWSPRFTKLEMIPLRRLRPTPRYFRAGNRVLDAVAAGSGRRG